MQGSRDDLVRELRETAEGWRHLGKDKLADQAEQGARALESGAKRVTVGHAEFEVTGEG